MLLSKREAIRRFHASTGLSIAASRKAVEGLKAIEDGKRKKYSEWHLDRAISQKRNTIVVETERVLSIRPISERRAREIRERCI